MKKILLLFILITNFSVAQRIAINGKDEFTDKHILKIDASSSKKWKQSDDIFQGLFNNGFLSLKYTSGTNDKILLTTLNITTGIPFCVNQLDGKIIFLLEDNSKITLNQVSDIECFQPQVTAYQVNKPIIINYSLPNFNEQLDYITTLSQIKINKIRIYTSDAYLDFIVNDDKKEMIKNTFKLLNEELKKITPHK